jgi:serine/threonine protein kinase
VLTLSDRYQIIQPIGRGGVGEVYEGRQIALDRPVAIKVLRPELTRNATAVARFEREARTTCRLHHPNVVTVFDVGTSEDGRRFLIMELLEGKTLAQRLRETPPLSYEECLAIAQQIVRGMGAGQGVGLVHRDLKPENIFLVGGNHVKILDFGLATLLSQDNLPMPTSGAPEEVAAVLDGDTLMLSTGNIGSHSDPSTTFDLSPDGDTASFPPRSAPLKPGRITDAGVAMGTPKYMAPEQVLGWDIDHRSDLYSFGCILYEMLAGHTPFEGPSSADFMRQHLHHPPAPLSESCPDIPDGMLMTVERLLRKSPSDRFSDWTSVAESLRRLVARATVQAGPMDTPSLDPPPEPYRFLHPFTENFQCIFFGRDADTVRFHDAWRHPDEPPLVLLTGASGVGKTSFLAARVIPALVDMGHQVVRVRGGARPLDQLHQTVVRMLARSESVDPDTPLPQLLDQLVAQHSRPVTVVLDQLEEVFTAGDDEAHVDLQAGFAALLSGGDAHIRVIVSIREDFLGPLHRCLHPLPVDEISRTVPLMPLREADLVAALEGPGEPGLPVAYPPFSFEPGLVDKIVSDLIADPSGEVAPRVQAVGARLWEMVQHDGSPTIRTHHYVDGLGGARGILARILNEAITDLSPGDRGVAKEMLQALTPPARVRHQPTHPGVRADRLLPGP